MDNGRGGDRSGLSEAERLLKTLQTGETAFETFEAAFLETTTTDFDHAARLVARLKRTRLPDPLSEAHKQRLIAWFQERRSHHKAAVHWARRAMKTFEAMGETAGLNQCRRVLFSSHAHLGRYAQARVYADQALADPDLPDLERVKILTNLGSLAYRVHDFATAHAHYLRALALPATARNRQSEAILMLNMGVLSISMNLFSEARDNLLRANALFEETGQGFFHAHTQQSLGYLYTILGQYYHASRHLQCAQDLYRALGDGLGDALCDIEMLRLDMRLNRFDEVLARVPDLAAAFQEKGRYAEIGLIYYQGIRAALSREELGLVREFLDQAHDIAVREQDAYLQASCTMVHGILACRKGRNAEGLADILRAGAAFGAAGMHERRLECLIFADKLGGLQGDADFALVRRLLKEPMSLLVRTQGLVMLQRFWADRGRLGRAVRCLFEAANLIEESRATISADYLRASYFTDKTEIYELLLERLLQWQDPSGAGHIFRIMELSRGRGMMERLRAREDLPPVLNRDEPLIMALHAEQTRLAQLNRKLEHLAGDSGASQQERAAVPASIAETRKALEALRRRMRHEERLGLFFPIDLAPEDIMALLEPGRLLVLYFLGRQTLYRIEVTAGGVKTYQHPYTADFMADFKRLMNILSYRIDPHMDQVDALAERLSSVLVPVGLRGIHHITFIMHKDLQDFPVAMLRRKGRLLLEDFLLSQCPNLAVFYFSRKLPEPDFSQPVLLFSNQPEDPTASERTCLVARFPEARVFRALGTQGLSEALSAAGFIHFAGHCVFDRHNPASSFLKLGGATLTLADFSRLRLGGHPFLNLAACQSAWTVVSAGNEPQGFVIGAFAAGAATLLAGLWELDDAATGAWMEQFYDQVHLGVAHAYRHACLHVRGDGANPYFWAGFCLLGRA